MWLHLKKERFSSRRKDKLTARGDDPYKMVHKVGENAYKIELSRDMKISVTFNVEELTLYIEVENEHNKHLGANHLQGKRLMWSKLQ